MNIMHIMVLGAIGMLLGACQPAGSPPDLVQTQRDALNKAKGVEQQLQQQSQDRIKSSDEADK